MMEKMHENKINFWFNFDMKSGDLWEILKISPKDCVIQSVDFLKNSIFDWNKFFIFWSGMEVLLWNSSLAMHDIDIQVISNGDSDMNNIIQNFEDNGFRCLEWDNPNKKVFIKWKMCFDIHFLEENDGVYVEHSNQWDFEYPVEWYWYTQGGIWYMKPSLCLQIAEGWRWNDTRSFGWKIKYKFWKRWRKNERRIKRLKELAADNNDTFKMKFKPSKLG